MTLLFQCEIPGRVYVKKNTRRQFGRFGGCYSPQYTAWERFAMRVLTELRFSEKNLTLPLLGPLNAMFFIEFENGKSIPDLTNCIEGPQDVLQKAGIIKNDSQICGLDGSRKIISGRNHLTIKLYKLEI